MLSVAINSNERIPNRKDSAYFDSYENPDWKSTPWYNRIFNFIYRVLYFITGPKFVVTILGNVPEKFNHSQADQGNMGEWKQSNTPGFEQAY